MNSEQKVKIKTKEDSQLSHDMGKNTVPVKNNEELMKNDQKLKFDDLKNSPPSTTINVCNQPMNEDAGQRGYPSSPVKQPKKQQSKQKTQK